MKGKKHYLCMQRTIPPTDNGTRERMIRIAIIGMGQRGKATLQRLRDIPQACVAYLCDSHDASCQDPSGPAFLKDWRQVVAQPDIQLIYICTPWDCHVEIAVEAMKAGKHVALEIPAAMTLRECDLLVRTSLSTDRHCVMLENCCYDTWHLGVREMVRQGMLGEVTHLEGAYIHTVADDWMIHLRRRHQGNPYPTHGLGPMCQLLREEDSMEYLVSMDTHNQVTGDNLNSTLIHTRCGVTMLLQYDISTPRPYNRLQTVCGTLGFAQKYPVPCIQLAPAAQREPLLLTGDEAVSYVEGHIPPAYRQMMEDGRKRGVANVMNYMMDRRLIEALESGRHPDTDVHEAALWSSIVELTERSARRGGERVAIPRRS